MRYSALAELGLCIAVFLAIPGGGFLLFLQDLNYTEMVSVSSGNNFT